MARKKRKADIDEDITESEVEKKTSRKEKKGDRGKKRKLTKMIRKVDIFDEKKSELGIESSQQESVISNVSKDKSKEIEDSIIYLSDASFNDTLDAAAKEKPSQVSVNDSKVEKGKVVQGLVSSSEVHIKEGKNNFNSEEEQDEDKMIDLSNSDISLPDCRGENGDQLVLVSSTPVRHRKTDSVSIGSSKKNLKGKDMLNLLKEIQKDGESEKNKGKKKKQQKISESSDNSATNREISTEILAEESTSLSLKHENKKHESSSNSSTGEHIVCKKNKGREKKKTDSEVINIEEGNVLQLSFSEYLDSISCLDQDSAQQKDEDNNSTLLTKVNTMKNEKTSQNSTSETDETETSLMLEKDNNKTNPNSKTRPIGIAKFFTKSSTPNKRKEEANSLTVKAVVHPEPSPPKIEVTSIDQTYDSKTSVTTVETVTQKRGRRRQKDDRIELLSTEIISNDEIEPGKKTADLDRSHSDDTRTQGKSENTDNTTNIKDKDDSLTENLSEVQKGENERKITFLKSSSKPQIPEKTSQPTLCFGKSGLTLTKPSSTHTTRVRKPYDGEEEYEKDRITQMGTDKKRDMTPAKKNSQTPNKKKNLEGKTPLSKHEGNEKSLGKKIGVESETDTNDNQDEENLAQSSKVSKKDKTGMTTDTPGKSGRGRKPSAMKCEQDIDSLTEMSCVQTIDVKASTPRRSRRGRKPLEANDDDSIDVAEVVDIETGDVEMSECEQGKPDSLENEISERRQSLRKRYMVTGFQMDEEKKTPIKIKLKSRYAKSSSSGEDSLFTPNSAKRRIKAKTTAKQTQAQKLIEKAKQHKSGMKSRERKISKRKGGNSIKKNRDDISGKGGGKSSKRIVDSTGRKSARLANKPKISMEELIILDIESESEEGDGEESTEPIKKKQGKKNTAKDSKGKPSSPKKPGSQKSPKKCGTPRKNGNLKLAPIFNKKVIEKNLQELPPIDPEKLRLRNEFLHSGLPDELKRQSAIHTAILSADYPPFPRPNHVQQILDGSKEKTVHSHDITGLNVWDLPKVNLKFIDFVDTAPEIKSTSNSLNLYRNVEIISDLSVIKNFSSHLELKVEHLEACLAEIQSFNPSCPVKRKYSVLKEMKSKSDISIQVAGQSVLLEPLAVSSQKRQCFNECDNADETETSKTTRKRCTRLSSSKDKKMESQDVGNREATTEEDKDKLTTVTLPWTEKYQPCKAFDILGNSNNIKRLKSWLIEWKQRVDRETRKAKKLLLKQSKDKKTSEEIAEAEKDDALWGDDSDFDFDSDDSEGEDDSLCNTMLITGPHGIGKTASVYALAHELGFKVFEVNASSSRSGKKILSQLQEATQSHQVSHNKEIGTPVKSAIRAVNFSSEMSSKGVGTKHSVLMTKMPSAFANFFQKEARLAPTLSQQSSKKPVSAAQASPQSRKRNRDKFDSEEAPQQKRIKKVNSSPTKVIGTAGKKKKDILKTVLEPGLGAKGLNLTSTSLILFDEVDVVFEEDKGFLAAIQTFMNSTKIPIIMITSQTSFASQFEGRFEALTFRPPSPLSITSHLQVMCLVENLRTDFDDLFLAVQFNNCDIRRCMLGLQFWVESGGGIYQCNRSIRVSDRPNSTILLQVNNDSQDTLMEDLQTQEVPGITSDLDDDDDFVMAKPVRIRSRRLIDEDHSDSLDGVAAFDKLITEKVRSESQQTQSRAEEEEKDLPKVHSFLVDSQITTSALIKKSLCSTIKTSLQNFPTSDLLEICARYRENRCDVLYTNLTQLLPLPRIIVESLASYVPNSEMPDSSKAKRRRTKSDLFDSEGSDEETRQEDDNDAMKPPMPSSDDTQDDQATKLDESDKSFSIHVQKSLRCFADYYDTMSLLDVMNAQMECKDLNRLRLVDQSYCRLLDGIDDIPSKFEQQINGSISQHQLGSELEVRSFHRFFCEIDSIQKNLENICENSPAKEAMTLSVLKGQDKFAVSVSPISTSSLESRIPISIKRCMDNVLNNLPLTVHNHHSDLSLDYLPLLQVISRSEQCRHLAKTKRRFHHYLDSIGMPLKESILNVLASSFS
ncbi:hypothetical protein CHS0354_007245 [Potamilus streckersoni]|uniref:AAA+ ATPase domain-containing protein n=1 Tax=Potamilus streckersoni TaxID=2493646 RepID=A0AAE0TDI5_9BIVA|nr:hypothetical protein CHS0354_007245 [Potamilus streckersoni]